MRLLHLLRRTLPIILITLLLLAFIASAIAGSLIGGGILYPMLRPLSAHQIATADTLFEKLGATREDLLVTTADHITLRGWKVRAANSNGNWVLLFHGVSDNRAGMLGQARLLLTNGYNVVMMDSRAHGESGGTIATYGWLERHDTRAVIDALVAADHPLGIFALGSSMGAALALQSAAIDDRILGVVAESSFSDLREVTYDYAGLQSSVWLGKTLFRPATWTAIPAFENLGGFSAANVSPEKAVAARAFSVLLICDQLDRTIPCRHTRKIFAAAIGPKQFWEVPDSHHAAALGAAPTQYSLRVLTFLHRLQIPAPPNRQSP